MGNKKAVSFKIEPELVARLKKVSAVYGFTATAIIEAALSRELDRIEKEHKPLRK